MSDILEIGLSDDDLMNLVVPDAQDSTANQKKLKKKRTKRYEKHLDKR